MSLIAGVALNVNASSWPARWPAAESSARKAAHRREHGMFGLCSDSAKPPLSADEEAGLTSTR